MSSGCCGTKKPKLNGAPAQTNGYLEDQHKHDHLKQSSNSRSSTGAGSAEGGGGGGGGDRSTETRLNQQNKVCSYNGTTAIPNGNPRNGLIPVACPEMCFYCFDVLYSHLHNMEPPGTPDFTNEPYPLFVTWKVGKDKRLRGCMGTFSHINLHQGLREYAATSAFKDSRFQPIGREELPRLGVSVSILRHFEEGRDFRDWDIGVHGIRIEFLNERGAKRTATYLPEVAPEQGWDHEQTIDSLLRKGGYKGPVTSEVRRSIKLTRYQSEKISVTSQEYMSYWRNRRC